MKINTEKIYNYSNTEFKINNDHDGMVFTDAKASGLKIFGTQKFIDIFKPSLEVGLTFNEVMICWEYFLNGFTKQNFSFDRYKHEENKYINDNINFEHF